MNTKSKPPEELAKDLSKRSICNVRVAAVVFDSYGICGWGWNSSGKDGMGCHAEAHAIGRTKRSRLVGATIAVYGERNKNTTVMSFPCDACRKKIVNSGISKVMFSTKEGWKEVKL